MKTFQASPKTQSIVDRAFMVHPLTPDQQQRTEAIHSKMESVARSLATLCPESEELHEAIALLKQVVYLAKDAIAKARE